MQKIILTRGQKDLLYDGNVLHTSKETFFHLPDIFMCRDGEWFIVKPEEIESCVLEGLIPKTKEL